MNADAFRYLYDYHFSENRRLWDDFIVHLSEQQFTQDAPYSMGSLRDQIIHLIAVEDVWFGELRGADMVYMWEPEPSADRASLRTSWDEVEQTIRGYLASLQDADLFSKPIKLEEDENILVWQALMQVINHGTDHRAQILRSLHDLGIETPPQDFIFYVNEHPLA